jgi:hypothetical protein
MTGEEWPTMPDEQWDTLRRVQYHLRRAMQYIAFLESDPAADALAEWLDDLYEDVISALRFAGAREVDQDDATD